MEVGFIGTGAMGAAMAGHVAAAGHAVLAHDADPAALDAAVGPGIRAARDVAEVAASADVVIVVVNTDAQTRAVVGAVLAAGGRPDLRIVVAGTAHPAAMIELGEACAAKGIGFVDAPVCNGLQGALAGDLVSLCGGSDADLAAVSPVLSAYSSSVEHLGPVGTGQIGKACNNMMHWALCVANFETLALAKACGLDAQAMRETLLKCPARNGTLERWDGTRFTWHEKDMDLVLDLSQKAGLSLPLFGAVDQLVKRLGPGQVADLLYGDRVAYLGQTVEGRPLAAVVTGRAHDRRPA